MSNHLVVLCGFPGAGKTFIRHSPGGRQRGIVLCPDEFRKVLTGQDFFAPAEEFVWGAMKLCARVLLSQRNEFPETIVIDATHLTKASRAQWITLARSVGATIECLWVDTPFDVCCERNDKRERRVPQEVMDRMRESFEEPTIEEGFDSLGSAERGILATAEPSAENDYYKRKYNCDTNKAWEREQQEYDEYVFGRAVKKLGKVWKKEEMARARITLYEVLDTLSFVSSYSCSECPVCCNRSLDPGEQIEHMKVTPDRCWICGYQEGNGTDQYPDNYDYVSKCWELQIPPYQELDLDRMGEENE